MRAAAAQNRVGPRHQLARAEGFGRVIPDAELEEVARNIKKLSESVPVVHAVMNNNYQDQGQRNAKTLSQFLQ